MQFVDTFLVALESLRTNLVRSLLTMLGIVIGVGAVIAMEALGRGAQDAVSSRIAALGTTLLMVVPGQLQVGGVVSASDRAPLYVEDAQALVRESQYIAAVEPEMARQFQVQFEGANTSTQVIGTSPNYLEVRKYTMARGVMFTAGDDAGRRRVAVLGATVPTNLGVSGAALLDSTIRINGIPFMVIGVLASKGGATGFADPDDQILIPLATAQFRVMDTRNLRTIGVLAPSEAMITKVMAEIERILRRSHHILPGKPDDFQIRNMADFLGAFAATTQSFTLLLAGIAAVSLLVGGIGIMNIMLVSVTERTREIGIRKAVGATRRAILLQFLIESVVLALVGGVLGALAGIGAARVLRAAANWNTAVSMGSVLLSFAFAAAVGVAFGVWPARRAAGLDPIDALRYE
ncbi:MAG TPA: ABC transporter permease [Gemmatimonadaceae bacterium]